MRGVEHKHCLQVPPSPRQGEQRGREGWRLGPPPTENREGGREAPMMMNLSRHGKRKAGDDAGQAYLRNESSVSPLCVSCSPCVQSMGYIPHTHEVMTVTYSTFALFGGDNNYAVFAVPPQHTSNDSASSMEQHTMFTHDDCGAHKHCSPAASCSSSWPQHSGLQAPAQLDWCILAGQLVWTQHRAGPLGWTQSWALAHSRAALHSHDGTVTCKVMTPTNQM